MNNTSTTRKTLLETFSKRLKDSVYQRDISYVDLENILGLGKSSISNYVAGQNLPSVDFLLGLEEVIWPKNQRKPV